MNKQDHLALRLGRLGASEGLDLKEESLTFLFSKTGLGKITTRRGTHRIPAGSILVFNGTDGTKLEAFDGQGEFQYWSFSVCFENLLPLFAGNEISLLHQITESFKNVKIYPATSALSVDCQRLIQLVPSQFDLDHRGQLVRIAATILAAEFKETLSQRNGYAAHPEDHMVQMIEKLSAVELINLSVSELASRFNCSRRHVNRLFHKHLGISVAGLRMEMRLLKAISLLRDANVKIINVAEQCGFNQLGLFNTCFKRRFGSSPGEWRKSQIKAVAPRLSNIAGTQSCPFQDKGLCPLTNRAESSNGADHGTVTTFDGQARIIFKALPSARA